MHSTLLLWYLNLIVYFQLNSYLPTCHAAYGVFLPRQENERSIRGSNASDISELGNIMTCDANGLKQYSDGFKRHFVGNNSGDFGKFLAVSMLIEQLSKSRKHLAEVMVFARLTNRTLVLPQCGGGFIGNSCFSKFPLCLYFDVDAIGGYVDWVTEGFFLKRLESFQNKKLTFHSAYLLLKPEDCNVDLLWYKNLLRPEEAWNRSGNWTMKSLQSGNHSCTANCANQNFVSSVNAPTLLRNVSNNTDVLLIGKSTMLPCIEHRTFLQGLRYSNKLVQRATEFADKHLGKSFLAIQWRLEMTITRGKRWPAIRKCMTGLVSSAKGYMEKYNLTGLFLATDAPHGSRQSSATLEQVGGDNLARLRTMSSNLTALLHPAEWTDFDKDYFSLDMGVRGILDKLVCARAKVLLIPPPVCLKMKRNHIPSHYTNEIVMMRLSKKPIYGTPKNSITTTWNL